MIHWWYSLISLISHIIEFELLCRSASPIFEENWVSQAQWRADISCAGMNEQCKIWKIEPCTCRFLCSSTMSDWSTLEIGLHCQVSKWDRFWAFKDKSPEDFSLKCNKKNVLFYNLQICIIVGQSNLVGFGPNPTTMVQFKPIYYFWEIATNKDFRIRYQTFSSELE